MSHARTGHRNIYRRGAIYYFRYRDETGQWRERRYGPNLQDAVLAQSKARQEADAIRNGLTTREKLERSRHQTRDFLKTLAEYVAHLHASKLSASHVQTTEIRCRAAAIALGWKTLDDIDAGQLDSLLVAVLEKGQSARTRNDHLVKLQAFANWCAERRGYLPNNPLRVLRTIPTATDPRRPVRALTPKEFSALLAAAPAGRRLAYWLAGGLGLRWTEIRKVRWSHVDLRAEWIKLPATISKNRRECFLPLPKTVLKALRGIPAAKRVDEICPHPPILRTFRADLAAAGVAPSNEAGAAHRRSLRKTFVTHLALSGVDLRTAQRLARHSRPELTANIYTDPHLLDMSAAMAKIAKLQGRSGKDVANASTRKRKSA